MTNTHQIFNLIAQIRRSHKNTTAKQSELLDQVKLNLLEWAILRSLHEKPVQSQAEVARSIALAPSNVRTPIEMLENRGLVSRQKDDRDRRINNTLLTKEGSDLVRNLLPGFESDHKKLLQGISAPEQKELERLLDIIWGNLKKK
ncbi:MAG: transcriptional regulator HosA [Saprospiraceae bacterium]|nr:MAG: transcriptional regulator HosA [Saprospiraceae bacterium]